MCHNEIRDAVLNKVSAILSKPRVNAYTPQALVETTCSLLSLAYNERKFQNYMFKEYGGTSKPWWLNEDLDYPTAVHRMTGLVNYLRDGNFELE